MLLEVLLLLAILVWFLYRNTCKPATMPPGTFGLPILGNLPPRTKHITQHIMELSQKYGPIFTTKWGSRIIVALTDAQLIKKALSHPDIQGRADFHSFEIMNHFNRNTGVIASQGEVWSENRRFLLRHLRDLGMGKTRLETSIQEEAEMLVRYIESHDLKSPIAMDWSINVAVLNVIWQLIANQRYEADDKTMQEFAAMFDEDMSIIQGPLFLLDVLPWIAPFTPNIIYDKVMRGRKFEENRILFRVLANKIISDHQKNLEVSDPRDIIDYYLVEMQKKKDESNLSFHANHSDLLTLISDMFLAGSDTTSNTLRWMVLYMALNPQIQKKVHDTLDKHVPKDRVPSLEDRPALTYVEAMLLDVLRLSSLAPDAFHTTTADVQFEGYTLPKNTLVIASLETCHRDPAYWEKPDQLHPEHFLDDAGQLCSKKGGFMPFSTGRRQCLGESLARMELFLFGAAILHRFVITPPPGVTLDTQTDKTMYILNKPKPFKVILQKRA